MKRPCDSNLIEYAPLEIWQKAEVQAKRSNLSRYRTGAVIFDKKGRILSGGCSHYSENPLTSVHAEEHAMSSMWPAMLALKPTCLVVTLTQADRYAGSSRPCSRCFNRLHAYRVFDTIWCERCNDGSWYIHRESVADMQDVIKDYDLTEKFAKQLKVVT